MKVDIRFIKRPGFFPGQFFCIINHMNISFLYNSGSEIESEDRGIVAQPFVGVADGVSETFYPGHPMRRTDGISGGEYIAKIFGERIFQAKHTMNPMDVIEEVNEKVALFQKKHRSDKNDEADMPGICFSLAKVKESGNVEIAQAGDCLAVWQLKSGTIGMTPNQVYRHDMEMGSAIAKYMKKYNGDRGKMWADFGPNILSPARRKRVNKKIPDGYGLLNGQENLLGCVFQKKLKNVSLLLLFTDGALIYENTGKKLYARGIVSLYKRGGLERIIQKTRIYEKKKQKTSHIVHAEATAIAIEF